MLRVQRYIQDVRRSRSRLQNQQNQLSQVVVNTGGQIKTTDTGVENNTADFLRAGPRGYDLLEDTTVRERIFPFDNERVPGASFKH